MYEIRGTEARMLSVDEVDLAVFVAGDGPLVVLLHGFPELAYSWRHLIAPLVEAGFRVAVPDQRGYGGSSRPESIESYRMDHLIGDVVGLIDALGADRAAVIGHDWGGVIAWPAAAAHPDRIAAVIGVNTPYVPRGPEAPTGWLARQWGPSHYVLRFQEVGGPDRAMARDVRSLFDHTFRAGSPPVDGDDEPATIGRHYLDGDWIGSDQRVLLTEAELDVYSSEFERTGFTGPLNWYRNLDANWEWSAILDGRRVDQPALFVQAEWDALFSALIPQMSAAVDDLDIATIAECGHWTNQDRPIELAALLTNWLTQRYPR